MFENKTLPAWHVHLRLQSPSTFAAWKHGTFFRFASDALTSALALWRVLKRIEMESESTLPSRLHLHVAHLQFMQKGAFSATCRAFAFVRFQATCDRRLWSC